MEEKQKNEPSKLQNQLTAIIVRTITRNANDTSKEFLEKISNGSVDIEKLEEDKVLSKMIVNALIEITRMLLDIEGVLNQSTSLFKLILDEQQLKELEEKTEQEKEI